MIGASAIHGGHEFVHIKCPFCFTTLDTAAAFACSNCPPVADPEASRYRGGPVVQPPVTTVSGGTDASGNRPTTATCPTCRTAARTPACPTCHALLPPGWMSTRTTCIALAGSTYTGKSIYIAVVVKQLAQLAIRLGGVLRAVTADTQNNYRDLYERDLFVERGLYGSTAPQIPGDLGYKYNTPLIYELKSSHGTPHIIVLRDVAGESLADPELDPFLFGFLRRADGIVYLIDPVQITRVRNQLRGFLPFGEQDYRDPLPVLGNVLRLFAADPERPADRVRMALTLSKFDALQSLREIEESSLYDAMRNHGAAYLRDPSYESTFDRADSDLLNLEINSLLVELDIVELQNLARASFRDWRWFAVSALGHQPGTRLGPTGITPFRCLDPVKWILAENGAIATE